MVIEAAQAFTLPYPGSPEQARAFVQDPARALSGVRFLRGLRADAEGVQGELVVQLPVLGEADLPFHSRVILRPDGADLEPLTLSGERAWVEVQGHAQVQAGAGTQLAFSFLFRAHLATPEGEGWGSGAFAKMVRAAAGRTLERIAQELPAGIAAAMD